MTNQFDRLLTLAEASANSVLHYLRADFHAPEVRNNAGYLLDEVTKIRSLPASASTEPVSQTPGPTSLGPLFTAESILTADRDEWIERATAGATNPLEHVSPASPTRRCRATNDGRA
jgi:hypothetical protein